MSSKGPGRRRPLSNPGSTTRPAAKAKVKNEGEEHVKNEMADVVPNVSIFNQLASSSWHQMISLILHLLSFQPWYCPPTWGRTLSTSSAQWTATLTRNFDPRTWTWNQWSTSKILFESKLCIAGRCCCVHELDGFNVSCKCSRAESLVSLEKIFWVVWSCESRPVWGNTPSRDAWMKRSQSTCDLGIYHGTLKAALRACLRASFASIISLTSM